MSDDIAVCLGDVLQAHKDSPPGRYIYTTHNALVDERAASEIAALRKQAAALETELRWIVRYASDEGFARANAQSATDWPLDRWKKRVLAILSPPPPSGEGGK